VLASIPAKSAGSASRHNYPTAGFRIIHAEAGTTVQLESNNGMNQGALLMRGLEKVRGEFSPTALAYILRRVLNIVGFTDLMMAAWS
jgi:hypothetical protein